MAIPHAQRDHGATAMQSQLDGRNSSQLSRMARAKTATGKRRPRWGTWWKGAETYSTFSGHTVGTEGRMHLPPLPAHMTRRHLGAQGTAMPTPGALCTKPEAGLTCSERVRPSSSKEDSNTSLSVLNTWPMGTDLWLTWPCTLARVALNSASLLLRNGAPQRAEGWRTLLTWPH